AAFLQHGSIPLTVRNRELAERVLSRGVAPVVSKTGGDLNFRSRYATVEEAAGRKIPAGTLAGAFREGFAEVFSVDFEEERLSPNQWASAREMSKRYASVDWNEKRSPAVQTIFPEAIFG
ncbi:MAG TPA: hypothetical protein VFR89_09015, partial [candidate division Zixibacteria bacterium]|nr:hypothetical protein [candidate division Zixibacteria bacterium]